VQKNSKRVTKENNVSAQNMLGVRGET